MANEFANAIVDDPDVFAMNSRCGVEQAFGRFFVLCLRSNSFEDILLLKAAGVDIALFKNIDRVRM